MDCAGTAATPSTVEQRTVARWYAGLPGERGRERDRYDHLYDEKELHEWAQKIHSLVTDVRQVDVLFDNCCAGQAPINAQAFRDLLLDLVRPGRSGPGHNQPTASIEMSRSRRNKEARIPAPVPGFDAG